MGVSGWQGAVRGDMGKQLAGAVGPDHLQRVGNNSAAKPKMKILKTAALKSMCRCEMIQLQRILIFQNNLGAEGQDVIGRTLQPDVQKVIGGSIIPVNHRFTIDRVDHEV